MFCLALCIFDRFLWININRYIFLIGNYFALLDSESPISVQLMKNATFIFTWLRYVIGVATWLMHGIKRPQGDIMSQTLYLMGMFSLIGVGNIDRHQTNYQG